MLVIFLCLIVLGLAGCQSKQTVMLAPSREARKQTPDENRSARGAPIGIVGNLREAEAVKAYEINRYVDAADSRTMHERHAIYRLEQQPSWITRSPKNQQEVILGPILGLRKPEYTPEPMPGETSREIIQARRGIEQANVGMKDLRERGHRDHLRDRLEGSIPHRGIRIRVHGWRYRPGNHNPRLPDAETGSDGVISVDCHRPEPEKCLQELRPTRSIKISNIFG
jgi:hypothetical protein